MSGRRPTRQSDEGQGELFGPQPTDWIGAYEDEVAAAEHGILFQPGYEPVDGKKLEHVVNLDPPGGPGPGFWLTREGGNRSSGGPARERRRARQ